MTKNAMLSLDSLPRKGLRIAHINICSLRNKMIDIAHTLSEGVHVLALTETHLDDTINDSVISVNGYTIFRRDRNVFGGGVAVYVKSHIPAKIRYDLMCDEMEAIWIQVHLPHLKPLLIGCCYRPPNARINYLDDICVMFDKVCDLDYEIHILGDLNINWSVDGCPLKDKLLAIANVGNLVQIVDKPTRVCLSNMGSVTATCIDHVFTNVSHFCSKPLSIPVGFSDHNLIAYVRKTKVPKSGPRVTLRRSMKHFNEDAFVNGVGNICWESVLGKQDPNDALDEFNRLFLQVLERHAPLRKYNVSSKQSSWLDSELKNLMKTRDEAKKRAVQSDLQLDWQNYRRLRNYVTAANKKKKYMFYTAKITELINDKKKLWNVMNGIMGRTPGANPAYLEVEGKFISKPLNIANYFNDYFHTKVNNLRRNMTQVNDISSFTLIKDLIMKNKNCKFNIEKVTINDVTRLLCKGKDSPSGVDNCDAKFLSIAAYLISVPVCYIFNLCVEKCLFPQDWKIAKVIPLSKNSAAPFSGANCRPISLLPALAKVMERIMFDQIQHYFDINNLNSDFQHAFRPGHSTCTALTHMTDEWRSDIDNGKLVGVVLLDFSAAFDVIDHSLLLGKLKQYGFSLSAIKLMESYLTNRSQSVFFNGSLSDIKHVDCGVPQGSCLGPLLFSIFVNDFPLVLDETKTVMYADDCTIYSAETSIAGLNNKLQHDLRVVAEWVTENKLILNVGKTKSIVIGSKYLLRNVPSLVLEINNIPVEQVYDVKLLGIIVDQHLAWSKHIDYIVNKMGRGVAMIKRVLKIIPQDIVKQVTNALVLSQLDYCFPIWSSASMKELNKLQVAQNKAARSVLQCSYRTNVTHMHEQLGWLSITRRSSYVLLNLIRNIIVNKSPNFLYCLFSHQLSQHNYLTRHAAEGRFILPRANTNVLKKSVLFRAILEWNALPLYIVLTNSKERYKFLLKQFLLMVQQQ